MVLKPEFIPITNIKFNFFQLDIITNYSIYEGLKQGTDNCPLDVV